MESTEETPIFQSKQETPLFQDILSTTSNLQCSISTTTDPLSTSTDLLFPNTVTSHNDRPIDHNIDEPYQPLNITNHDLEKLSTFLAVRLANLFISSVLIVVAVFSMILFESFPKWILSVYTLYGAALIFCFEVYLKPMRYQFDTDLGFLYSPFLRLAYYVLLCMICWSLGHIYGKCCSIVLGVIALVNTYVMLVYPDLKGYQKKIAEDEDKRIARYLTMDDEQV